MIHGCNLNYWKVLTTLVVLTRWQSLNIVAEQGLSTFSREKPSKSGVLKIKSILIDSDNFLSSNCWWRPIVATVRCTVLRLANKQAVLWFYSFDLCVYIKHLCRCYKTGKISLLSASSSTLHTRLHFNSYNCITFYDCSLSWHHTEHVISVPLMYTVACFAILCRWMSVISIILVCPQLKESLFLFAGSPTRSIVLFCVSTQQLLTEMLY